MAGSHNFVFFNFFFSFFLCFLSFFFLFFSFLTAFLGRAVSLPLTGEALCAVESALGVSLNQPESGWVKQQRRTTCREVR